MVNWIKLALIGMLLVAMVGAGLLVVTAQWGQAGQTSCGRPDRAYVEGSRLLATADRVGIASWKRMLLLRAIDRFTQSLQECPGNTSTYISRAVAYSHIGQYDQAIADYDAYLRIYPDAADAIKNRGITYQAQGKLQEALADYETFLRLIAAAPGERRVWERGVFAEKVKTLQAELGE